MTDTTAHAETFEGSLEEFPCRLVVMIYNEAIESLEDAIEAIAAGNIAARFHATAHTAEAVHELQQALDLDQGGEIAANLDQIYTLIMTQLPVINMHNDAKLAKSLIGLLTPLRDSWVELDERIRHDVELAESGMMGPLSPAAERSRIATAVR